MMKINRAGRIAAASLSALFVVLHMLPHHASAHAYVEPASVANGKTVKVAIGIPHGCEAMPTDAVSVTLPAGFVSAQPQAKAGWTIATQTGPYGASYEVHGKPVTEGVLAVSWSGGSLPSDQFDEFVIRGQFQGVVADEAKPFVISQTCGDQTIVWDQIAEAGEDAHALEHPAPTVTVTATAEEHGHAGHGDAAAVTVDAAEVAVGDLALSGGFARATLPNAPVGGGFLTIANSGAEADRLLSVTSPYSDDVQIHEMKMENDVMEMRALPDGITIGAGETVTLSPGGVHLMFMAIKQPFVEGDAVPVTLTFEKAGPVDLVLSVAGIAAKEPAAHDHTAM